MNREILRLALPNILSNLSVPLLGIVDTALMGRQPSPAYLGAVALATIIFNFLYWGMGFLRMGTTGLTAQAYGQGENLVQLRLLGQALLLGLAAGCLFVLFQIPIERLSFWLLEGDQETIALGQEYYYIRIWAAPATIGLYALVGWLLGMQEARIPMWLTIFSNVINIGLNFFFVYELEMASAGVALATVMAQYAGLILGLIWVWKKYRTLLNRWREAEIFDPQAIKRFFSVNSDIFIRTVCLIFAFSYFTAQSSRLDLLLLAANQILLQYLHTMAYAVDGFAFAAESLVGKYTGRRDPQGLEQSIRYLFIWGMGFAVIFALLYLLAGTASLSLFTDQAEVIAAAEPYLQWMALLPLLGAYAYLWDGIYFGATAARPMRNAMLITTFGVFLPLAWLSNHWGNHWLWAAMAAYLFSRGLGLHLFAKKYIRIP